MTSIRRWLDSLDLGQYADAFEHHAIEWTTLRRLDHELLREIGVKAVGHRVAILDAIEQLPEADSGADAGAASTHHRLPSGEAERRQLTVMFCDLVGSTALSERMDPEDLREVIAAYQSAATGAIERFDGYIARYMGDGLLVYFGYPQAHEDDAERAVRSGLGIVEAVAALSAHQPVELQVRIGIATGLVVAGDLIGEGASQERAVLGDTPNLAARLQGIADPDRVIVSESTRRLIDGLFEGEAVRGLSLKGISSPVSAFLVDRESAVSSRFEAIAARGLAPLVGRKSELSLLSGRWAQARAGEGQVVLLSGEPGVGKSRIVRALVDHAAAGRHARVSLFGSPYHTNSAYYPVVEQLRRAFDLAADDEATRAVEKLDTGVSQLGLVVEEFVPILASLLSVPATGSHPALELSPQALRRKTLETLERLIDAQAAAQPLLLIVEDAHWLDASSLDLLGLIVDGTEASSILMVITFRPEFEPPWLGHAHVTAHTLNRLGRSDTTELIREVSGETELPSDLVDEIVARTDGVPLFIEELTKTLLESGRSRRAASHNVRGGGVPAGAIPASLQDSLMARLDQLAPMKQVAQFAAVLGRRFSRDWLVSASPFEEESVDSALAQLVASGLVYRRGTEPSLRYEFKHALVCDAAYESLLNSSRQDYHARIARALEQQFPVVVETEPEQLARHYTEADLAEQAIPFWRQAGIRSLDRSAIVEAITALENGLGLIESLPLTRERNRLELDFQLLLASAHGQRGMTSEGARSAYLRAKDLVDEVGNVEQRFRTNFGLWFLHQHGGELDAAREISDELLVVADEQDDPGLKLEACHAGWTTRFVGEELDSVIELTERGMALYDANRYRDHRYRFGHDAGACGMTMNALTLMFLGFAEQASDRARDALALVDELDHPVSKTHTLSFCTNIFRLRGEPDIVESWINTQLALCEQYGFSGQVPFGQIIRGWALCAQGQGGPGIEEICKGLETIRSFGIKTLSFQLCALADAYWLIERYEEGLETVGEAIEVIETVGEHRWEPEVYRLKGEMLLRTNGSQLEAETAFRRGARVAHEQGARWFELRSITSLASLWREQGKREEAHDLLCPVYDSFTEGFDTPDLREARTLLEKPS